jgi:alkylation response protein AidB-like acyl-CoA dehydrogenase
MESLFERSIQDLARFGQKLSDADREVLERVDAACDELVVPEFEAYTERRFNEQVPKILAQSGLFGIPISKEYGGLGCSTITYTLAVERMGQVGMGLVTFIDVQTSLCELTLQQWGTEDQKKRYLESAAKGGRIMAYALTEPDAGSDPSSLTTSFEESAGGYLLNGSKYLISNGSIADSLIVFAHQKGRSDGFSAFLVDSDTEGFSVAMHLKEKLGLFTSDTALLEFKDCMVPKENMLGSVGAGMRIAYSALVNGRFAIAAGCVGVIEDCLNSVLERARSRVQHGKEIGKHQLIQGHISSIATSLEMAKWPTYLAALKKMDQETRPDDLTLRNDIDLYSAIAKRIASRLAYESADLAVQVFGGFGYSILSPPGRHLLDSRVGRIYEGTDEIMDLKIASRILGKGYEAYT